MKKSAKGLLRIEGSLNGFTLFDEQTAEQEQGGALKQSLKMVNFNMSVLWIKYVSVYPSHN